MKRPSISSDDIELSDGSGRMRRMPLMSSGRSVGSRFFNYSRHFRAMAVFLTVAALVVWVIDTWGNASLDWAHEDMDDALTPDKDEGQRLRVLIPATHGGVDLCKLTMGLAILGYPEPVLLGYGKDYTDPTYPTDGGAQLGAKITDALAYVNTISDDEELVVMVDAYDSWFQLPEPLLRARYFRSLYFANRRMRERLGRRAVRREELKQKVVFGAAKACTPNGVSSVACYPVPEAPPTSYYTAGGGGTSDSKHARYRPRYLDAGFMMGPAGDVRRILERAQEIVQELPSRRTPHGVSDEEALASKYLWGGDAQGIFNRIFGEQAYQREVMRQRYRSWFKKYSPPRIRGSVEERVYADMLDPDFPHEGMDRLDGHPREFGINVDHFGRLVSNTAESEADHRNGLLFDGSAREEWEARHIAAGGELACRNKLNSTLPIDLVDAAWPSNAAGGAAGSPSRWADAPLIGNACLGSVPVVVHHNGDKALRESAWPEVWYHQDARASLDRVGGRGAGALTDRGQWMAFGEMCPEEYHEKLF